MRHELDCKKQILAQVVKDFRLEGELPDIGLLKNCLEQMNPGELAQSIYFLEYSSAETHSQKTQRKYELSLEVKNAVQKIFLALAQHFQRNPDETEKAMDSMMHYLSKALLITVLKHNLISMN
ncbi:MAG: hypothetical protein HQM15_11600 [Deltaproteobacteria bacterium]|nr:hypothetical protein [Deltaproteobacteria bacterium]